MVIKNTDAILMGRACAFSAEGGHKAVVTVDDRLWFFLLLVPAVELGTGDGCCSLWAPWGSVCLKPQTVPTTQTHYAFGSENLPEWASRKCQPCGLNWHCNLMELYS